MYGNEKIRELMRAVSVPPTGADIGLAKATGRRRKRNQRMMTGALALLIAGSGTYFAVDGLRPGRGQQSATGQTQFGCTVEVLDVPSGSRGRALAVDSSGQIVAGSLYNSQWQASAVRFVDGRTVRYPELTGTVVALNTEGLIVGYDDADSQSHTLGWTYHDGKKSMLVSPAGYQYTRPIDVNARGDIVGTAFRDALDDSVPVLWPADKPGTVQELAVPDGFGDQKVSSAQAVGVTDDGTVIGNVRGVPVRWAVGGIPSVLPVPVEHRYASVSVVRGRYAYGSVQLAAAERNAAARWDLQSGQIKVHENGPADVADGTSDGWSVSAPSADWAPMLISPDGLAEPLPLPQGLPAAAFAMSDDGKTIVGATGTGDPQPVIWHC
jgi:uncharacterized membrane protein